MQIFVLISTHAQIEVFRVFSTSCLWNNDVGVCQNIQTVQSNAACLITVGIHIHKESQVDYVIQTVVNLSLILSSITTRHFSQVNRFSFFFPFFDKVSRVAKRLLNALYIIFIFVYFSLVNHDLSVTLLSKPVSEINLSITSGLGCTII